MNKLFDHTRAKEAEQLGALLPEWLERIYQEKWFKLFVPKKLGGLGCGLPEALRIEESLAYLDGSLGWTVTLCAGAGWFVGFLDENLRQRVFPSPKLCLAGSGFVGGKAERFGDAYVINGSWTYASGALHATHFTANCEIWEKGQPVLDAKGNPVVKAFLLEKNEVEILDSWHFMGMVATGSHAFRAEGIHVPLNHCFELIPHQAQLPDAVYQYPFLQFAETTLAVNILGIAQHLQALIAAAFWKRHDYRKYTNQQVGYFEKTYAQQTAKLTNHKNTFYQTVEDSWVELENTGSISKVTLKKVSRISRRLTQICRETSARLYPFAGLEAAQTQTELNRVWRDFHTVGQHALLVFPF